MRGISHQVAELGFPENGADLERLEAEIQILTKRLCGATGLVIMPVESLLSELEIIIGSVSRQHTLRRWQY
jgi:hypothetical protein